VATIAFILKSKALPPAVSRLEDTNP